VNFEVAKPTIGKGEERPGRQNLGKPGPFFELHTREQLGLIGIGA
jgi:hypothetical protein